MNVSSKRNNLNVSTHSRPKAAGGVTKTCINAFPSVSTRSRAKAAGIAPFSRLVKNVGFNSQPREGGWLAVKAAVISRGSFNSQPPEGGWLRKILCRFNLKRFNSQPPEGGWEAHDSICIEVRVSTRSRPKAAGKAPLKPKRQSRFQLAAARRRLALYPPRPRLHTEVSTRSRPKAAGCALL